MCVYVFLYLCGSVQLPTYMYVTACTFVHNVFILVPISQDKENSVRHDLSRDTATAQALQRKHKTFDQHLEIR